MTQIAKKWVADSAIDHTKLDSSDVFTMRGLTVKNALGATTLNIDSSGNVTANSIVTSGDETNYGNIVIVQGSPDSTWALEAGVSTTGDFQIRRAGESTGAIYFDGVAKNINFNYESVTFNDATVTGINDASVASNLWVGQDASVTNNLTVGQYLAVDGQDNGSSTITTGGLNFEPYTDRVVARTTAKSFSIETGYLGSPSTADMTIAPAGNLIISPYGTTKIVGVISPDASVASNLWVGQDASVVNQVTVGQLLQVDGLDNGSSTITTGGLNVEPNVGKVSVRTVSKSLSIETGFLGSPSTADMTLIPAGNLYLNPYGETTTITGVTRSHAANGYAVNADNSSAGSPTINSSNAAAGGKSLNASSSARDGIAVNASSIGTDGTAIYANGKGIGLRVQAGYTYGNPGIAISADNSSGSNPTISAVNYGQAAVVMGTNNEWHGTVFDGNAREGAVLRADNSCSGFADPTIYAKNSGVGGVTIYADGGFITDSTAILASGTCAAEFTGALIVDGNVGDSTAVVISGVTLNFTRGILTSVS